MRDSNPLPRAQPGPEICVNHWANSKRSKSTIFMKLEIYKTGRYWVTDEKFATVSFVHFSQKATTKKRSRNYCCHVNRAPIRLHLPCVSTHSTDDWSKRWET